jgi:S-ribosylhomocysteine lyase LuxS involved in autoinducer biosynthesis
LRKTHHKHHVHTIAIFSLEWSTTGKGKVKIHEDINHNIPIAEKIMVRYLGSLEHPMAKALMSSVKNGDSVILEISPSYYSTWDYSKR